MYIGIGLRSQHIVDIGSPVCISFNIQLLCSIIHRHPEIIYESTRLTNIPIITIVVILFFKSGMVIPSVSIPHSRINCPTPNRFVKTKMSRTQSIALCGIVNANRIIPPPANRIEPKVKTNA